MKIIPYGKQSISQSDIDAVKQVLDSDFLTQGPAVPKFEEQIAMYCGAKFGVATSNATAGLHLACLALGVTAGDVVWTSPITFVASANCALYCSATIDFVDISLDTYNMCPVALEKKLIDAELAGTLPKVVIPVHLGGQSCDMKAIHKLSKKYGFSVIEDASHAIGARYLDDQVGCCKFSDITVFSFHPVKIITTGEGGLAVTNDEVLDHKMKLLRSHGITRDENRLEGRSEGPWYYQQLELGFNYRMTDIQAALGSSQFQRLDEFISTRHKIAGSYDTNLENSAFILPHQNESSYSSYHLYVVRLKVAPNRLSHREVVEFLRNSGIGVNLHYIPVYHHPYYKRLGFERGYCKNAELYYGQALSVPIFPGLNWKDQKTVIDCLLSINNE
jgi:UDP-4-amino-4,6-dideoxy-N-acetyl-beta-L-altrosamine transaminase